MSNLMAQAGFAIGSSVSTLARVERPYFGTESSPLSIWSFQSVILIFAKIPIEVFLVCYTHIRIFEK